MSHARRRTEVDQAGRPSLQLIPVLTYSLHVLQVDPTLTRADRLVGQVLGQVGQLPDVYTELEINFFLLRRLLGVRTSVRSRRRQSCQLIWLCTSPRAFVSMLLFSPLQICRVTCLCCPVLRVCVQRHSIASRFEAAVVDTLGALVK